MRAIRLLVPALALLVAFATASFATPEIQKQVKKPCATCHSKGKELNATGKYYKEKKTLDGAPAPAPPAK
jgi:hypothetical protein